MQQQGEPAPLALLGQQQLLRQRSQFLLVLVDLPLLLLAEGDIDDGQQDHLGLLALAVDAPGVEQHGPAPDVLEIMLDLVVLEAAVVRQDVLQEPAQLRDIPLPVAELVDEPALGFLRRDPEGLVERLVGRDHAEILIQHQERLLDGIGDALGKLPGLDRGLLGAVSAG